MSLSQRATCHILSGHKESTSLFEAEKVDAEGVEQRKGGCRRGGAEKRWLQQEWGREKVAAAEIVKEANPERKKGKGRGDFFSQREVFHCQE